MMRTECPDGLNQPLSIVVVGASGDLARKKTFPALFALFCQEMLPDDFAIFGFARSAMSREDFRKHITANLTCRYVPGESCAEKMNAFLERCFYVQGQYKSSESFVNLQKEMRKVEKAEKVNRLFYMAIPPSIFVDVGRAISEAGFIRCGACTPWSRIVVEKPFGRDRASSDLMVEEMAKVFSESQTFRIDHYLGKEVIQNLMVLRFANLIFEPIWNREYIKSVSITWQEDLSVEGRAGYFDHYGIIRDVIQNHLLQIMSLVAMEPCTKMDAGHIGNQKVRVLRSIAPLDLEDVVVGQYTAQVSG
jgi:glucose-6-phosphate 1-dehydrogenase